MATTFLKKRAWLWVLVLLVFIGISFVNLSQQPQQYQPYLSESPSPTGVKAIYTYVNDEYGSVSRWSHEPSLLPKTNESQLLIMVQPHFIPPEQDMQEYRDFVDAGNTILLFSESNVEMFGVSPEQQPFLEYEEGTIQSEDDDTEYEGTLTSPIRFQQNDDIDVLLSDEVGAKAVKRSFGEGEIIVANSPQWLMNGSILENDHTPLVLSLIDEGWQEEEILFDDYIHGGSPTIATLYPQWFLIILLQGGLVAILWLWYKGKRFGPITIPREESVRFSDEGIKALAAWYLRAKDSRFHESLKIQADYVKQLMYERWGIPVDKKWNERVAQIEQKSSLSKTEIDSFSKGISNVLTQPKITKKEYVSWSKKLDRMRKEVEER